MYVYGYHSCSNIKKRLYRIGNQSENIPVVHLGNRQINERGKTVSIKHYNI